MRKESNNSEWTRLNHLIYLERILPQKKKLPNSHQRRPLNLTSLLLLPPCLSILTAFPPNSSRRDLLKGRLFPTMRPRKGQNLPSVAHPCQMKSVDKNPFGKVLLWRRNLMGVFRFIPIATISSKDPGSCQKML